MEFRTFCDNKGCNKEMSPVVDPKTMEVFCTECGNKINCVSGFMARQLVSFGRVKRLQKQKLPWSIQCQDCKQYSPPDLKDDNLVCPFCHKPHLHLAKPFEETIRQHIKTRKNSNT